MSAFCRSLPVEICFKISLRICFTEPIKCSGAFDRSSGNTAQKPTNKRIAPYLFGTYMVAALNFLHALARCYTLPSPLADAPNRPSVICGDIDSGKVQFRDNSRATVANLNIHHLPACLSVCLSVCLPMPLVRQLAILPGQKESPMVMRGLSINLYFDDNNACTIGHASCA